MVPDVVSAQGLDGCVVDGCGKPIVGRGRCRTHYMRWWRATPKECRPPALNLKRETPAERFWAKVDKRDAAECWLWTGSTHESGHGEFFVSPDRGKVPAHVYAIEVTTGEVCPEGKEGCHWCDNPPCVNPEHAYYGTRQQNVEDMWARGRARRGSRHPSAKLTETTAVAIRVRFAAGELQPQLAVEFGVSAAVISNVVNGKSWKHVGGPIRTQARPGRRSSYLGVAA